jgi:nicotinamidase/pyrazinamidase
MLKKKVDLLVIDPQVGFCQPGKPLYVPGAEEDMNRLAALVSRISPDLNDIHITLDSHHEFDISHPSFWVNQQGDSPSPFTLLTYEDFKKGVLRPRFSQYNDEVDSYLSKLKATGRYDHMIWPQHCLIGSDEAMVIPVLYNSIHKWETDSPGAFVDYVTKGSNYLREHYSAVKAEVEDPRDPTTKLNMKLIQMLEETDEIITAGEALSHCFLFTLRDIFDNFKASLSKFVLFEDATSPVPGFESQASAFISDIKTKGVRVMKTTDYKVY